MLPLSSWPIVYRFQYARPAVFHEALSCLILPLQACFFHLEISWQGKAGQLAPLALAFFRAAPLGFDGAGFFHDHASDSVAYQFEDILTPKGILWDSYRRKRSGPKPKW